MQYSNYSLPYVLRNSIITFLVIISYSPKSSPQEGGYVNSYTVSVGDTLKFYISTSVSPFDLTVFKIEQQATFFRTLGPAQGGVQSVPDSAFHYGCGWQVTYQFVIPADWGPGAYRANFPITGGVRGVIFFVRPKTPGSYSKLLLILSTNTWQAYNNFGGKSIYEYNSTDFKRAYKVSFNRPAADPLGTLGSADFYKYEYKFIQFASNNNLKFEFASNYDLDIYPDLLKNYEVALLVGHNEYWSRTERLQLENFINKGGRLIILAGNTSWWQVRFEDNGKTMVCYKDRIFDPLNGVVDSLVTVNWWNTPVNYPENLFTGVSFRHGGFVNAFFNGEIVLPHEEGYGDYAAYNTHHWAFNGTGLRDGEEFGYDNAIVGYETDGTLFGWQNGIPYATGEDSSPVNLKILGISPAINYNPAVGKGYGTVVYFHTAEGSAVFNGATTDWVDGLYSDPANGLFVDPIVARITLNVINKFLENRFPPEINNWYPSRVQTAEINGEEMFLNVREYLVKEHETLGLTINASDPYGESVNYIWKQNGEAAGSGSFYVYANSGGNTSPQKVIISGCAFNSKDTASISWEIFNRELVIASDPVTIVKPGGEYQYKLRSFNYYNDDLTYTVLAAPSWIQLDSDGFLGGTAPLDTGSHATSISVSNEHAQSDTQSFTLSVKEIITSVEEELKPISHKLFQNYPNPFNPSTTISFQLSEAAVVSLKVYDVLGREASLLVNNEFKSAGNHSVIFHSDEFPSGIYIYFLSVGSNGRAGDKVFVNKMVLQR